MTILQYLKSKNKWVEKHTKPVKSPHNLVLGKDAVQCDCCELVDQIEQILSEVELGDMVDTSQILDIIDYQVSVRDKLEPEEKNYIAYAIKENLFR